MPEPQPEARRPRGLAPLLEGLGLALLWALLYLPNSARGEFVREEGRRVLPAREMLATGDCVLPSIWGRPYLAKPPGMYWVLAAFGRAAGGIDEGTARLPSELATLATALLVFAFGARFLPRRTALLAAVLFLLTPLVLEKGNLAEIEALLVLEVFAASALFWSGARGRPLATAGAALALAAAVLTKGPAAWVFFGASTLALASVERARARRVLGTGVVVLAASAALAGIWLVLLVRQVGVARLSEIWSHEVTGGERTFLQYLLARGPFAARALGGLLPGAALLCAASFPRVRRAWLDGQLERVTARTALLGFLFFLVFPRAEARYVLPLAPWLALLAASVLARACEPLAGRAARAALGVLAALAVVLGAGLAVGAPLIARGLFALDLELDGLGLVLAAMAGAAALASAYAWRRRLRAACLVASLSVFAFLRLLELAERVPQRADHDGRRASAARIAAVLPPGAGLHASSWSEFNLLAHLARPIRWAESAADVPPGDVLLALDATPELASDPEHWRILERIPLEDSGALAVALRLAPDAGGR